MNTQKKGPIFLGFCLTLSLIYVASSVIFASSPESIPQSIPAPSPKHANDKSMELKPSLSKAGTPSADQAFPFGSPESSEENPTHLNSAALQSTTDDVPQTIPIPPSPMPTSGLGTPEPLPPSAKAIRIRGPEKPITYAERPYFPVLPDFYVKSRSWDIPVALRTFLKDTLIPKESTYFHPSVGVDAKTGMPYDHVRIRLKENLLSEVGNYTAASKLSLLIPYLIKIIQKKPEFQHASIQAEEAKALLKKNLETILSYIEKYPDYGGFLPWVDIRPNGTIAPANTKMPSLDNGQLTWALAAVVAAFEDSAAEDLNELASLASTILSYQNYWKFYDPEKKLLHGTIQVDPLTHTWYGDKTYYLNDMFEGTLAVLWGVLNQQIPEDAWYNLAIPTTEYSTQNREEITTLAGFRASFHEHWALGFLPLMDSALGPLYQNYLYIQTDYARRHHMPGFLSTAYDPKGIYRQMGVPEVAYNPVDRDDVSVFFATAMSMLISPEIGASWLVNFYHLKKFVSPYGALESVGRDGYSDIFTADAKGMTLLAVSGGVIGEIEKYLKERPFGKTKISMYVKLIELLHAKYKQMLQERDYRPIYFPTTPFPPPTTETFPIRVEKLPDPGPIFDITEHLQSGHLHGKNIRSIGQKTLEQDIFPGKPIGFEFEIPAYFVYFDQWAFRGTYIDNAIKISDMRYLNVTVPTNCDPTTFEVELKSDDITLAAAVIETSRAGILSEDGQWKTLVQRIEPIPEADYKPFNYVSIALHDPRYLLSKVSAHSRQGTIQIQKLSLSKITSSSAVEKESRYAPGEFELLSYWRPSHGGLPFYKNVAKAFFHFSGGAGWRGGYIPYTNLSKFNYLYLRVRSLQEGCNCFYVELKHEGNQLLRYKVPIHIRPDKEWHTFEIQIPENIRETFNYFAISDPFSAFELGSILLSRENIPDSQIEKVPPPIAGKKPLECTYRPCEGMKEE